MPDAEAKTLADWVKDTLVALSSCYICAVPLVDFDEIVEASQFWITRPVDAAPDAQPPWIVRRIAHTGCWRNKIDALAAQARSREAAGFGPKGDERD